MESGQRLWDHEALHLLTILPVASKDSLEYSVVGAGKSCVQFAAGSIRAGGPTLQEIFRSIHFSFCLVL